MSGWSNWASGWITHEQIMYELAAAWEERYPGNPFARGMQPIGCIESLMRQIHAALSDWAVMPNNPTANHTGLELLTDELLASLVGGQILWELPRPSSDQDWLAAARQMRSVLNLMTLFVLPEIAMVGVKYIASRSYDYDEFAADFTGGLEAVTDNYFTPDIYVGRYGRGSRYEGAYYGGMTTGQYQKAATGFAGRLYLYGRPSISSRTPDQLTPELLFDNAVASAFDLVTPGVYTLLASPVVAIGPQIINFLKTDAVPVIPTQFDPDLVGNQWTGFGLSELSGYVAGAFEYHA